MKTSLRSAAVLAALLIVGWSAAVGAAEGKVNINTATAEQLSLLPRVGPSVAERIIQFRDENGSFKKPEDLLLVSGIGDRTFDQIRPYVVLEGETTLRDKVSSSDGSS
jgi:competence protein ComEA